MYPFFTWGYWGWERNGDFLAVKQFIHVVWTSNSKTCDFPLDDTDIRYNMRFPILPMRKVRYMEGNWFCSTSQNFKGQERILNKSNSTLRALFTTPQDIETEIRGIRGTCVLHRQEEARSLPPTPKCPLRLQTHVICCYHIPNVIRPAEKQHVFFFLETLSLLRRTKSFPETHFSYN